jgi:hypothetical protein
MSPNYFVTEGFVGDAEADVALPPTRRSIMATIALICGADFFA